MNKKKNLITIIHDSLFMIRKSRGFTLIELLVAIIIIGLLAGLLTANFVGVRQRTRDGVRKSDLGQIRSALEFYRSDSGLYPVVVGGDPGDFPNTCDDPTNPFTDSAGAVIYMREIPCDPLNTGDYVYTYAVGGGGATYSIVSCLENVNDSQKDPSNDALCTGGTTNWSFTVNNP